MASRSENGGHSTKSKGFDKRKNQYKEVLENALNADELTDVIKMLYLKATSFKDVAASKIILEYYLGKPIQPTDITSNGESIGSPTITFTKVE